MTRHDPPSPEPVGPDPAPPGQARPDHRGWLQRRRDKVAAEIARNRRGEHKVPTWVLALVLVVFVAAWAALVILG